MFMLIPYYISAAFWLGTIILYPFTNLIQNRTENVNYFAIWKTDFYTFAIWSYIHNNYMPPSGIPCQR